MFLGLAGSFTAGLCLLCLALLVGDATRGGRAAASGPVKRGSVYSVAGLVLLAVAAHLVVATSLGPVGLPRAIGSMIPLLLLLCGSGALANALQRIPSDRLHLGIHRCFIAMSVLAVLGILGIAPINLEDWRRPVTPFPEPSNFALAFLPLLFYACATTHGAARACCALAGFACAAMLQNLTLMTGCALVALTTIPLRVLITLAIPAVVALSQFDLAYYADRLDTSGESTNLSNLVYLQGWQMIGEAMERSGGFGIGFQQLGVAGTDVPAAVILRGLRQGEDLNELDGGFVLAKFASDFGVFGIALTALYLGLAARSLLALRRIASRRLTVPTTVCLAHCATLAYSVELFVRGSGYFTSGSLLLLTSLWLLRRPRRTRAAKKTVPRLPPHAAARTEIS